jgi:kynureninase
VTQRNRAALEALDRADELRAMREQFELPPDIVYLDGNSLGALSRRTRERLAQVVSGEWGKGLIRSWNSADWISLPTRVGDRIARLIGAEPGTVIAADSTSVNLYKLLSMALQLDPPRRLIVTERGNFPTDLYVAQGLMTQLAGCVPAPELVRVEGGADAIAELLQQRGDEVAVVFLTHVDYVSGRLHDMRGVTLSAHAAGALMLWDLSHSAGALPLSLAECDVDLAVGCGYKYLNGGPGAPAYLYVARRLQDRCVPPLTGWMGHADPFAFSGDYQPAPGMLHYLCGTHSVLAMSALETGVELLLEAPMEALRRKSMALGDLFIELVDTHCGNQGLNLISPRDGAHRGSQVAYTHRAGYAVMQALIACGVIGDFRAPDVLRFGFAPLYVRYVDVWDAVMALARILREGSWDQPGFQARAPVT